MKYVICFCLFIGACSSEPRIVGVDELSNYETSNHKADKVFKTKSGNLLSVEVETLVEKLNRLESAVKERDEKLERRDTTIRELQTEMVALRLKLGLSPMKPSATFEKIDADGNLVGFKDAPSLNEELK